VRAWRYDGMLMGDPCFACGRLYRVFQPRWWQLHRWLWWVVVGVRRVHGRSVLSLADGDLEVRVVEEVRVRLPRVPSANP